MADAAAKRRRTCIGGGISALPEHVLHGILSRVGNFKDLFMFAVTCRRYRWLCRFTDPAFLRELCPNQGEGHRARLLGCFLQQHVEVGFDRRQRQMVEAAPTFLPGPGSPLGPTARALTSFVSDDDGTFNYAEPLSARRGILLLELAPRTFKETTCHLFALCNPITGERHILPPLEWSLVGSKVKTYAIVTAADSNKHDGDGDGGKQPPLSASSQLLLTTKHAQMGMGYVRLHTYSPATRSWSTPTMFLNGWDYSLVGERSAVVHQGAAHWLCIDDCVPNNKRASGSGGDSLHKLSVELATSRVSLTKLPVRVGGRPLLCVSRDGKLVVATVYPAHVTVWTHQGGDDGGDNDDTHAAWPRTAAFRIPTAVPYTNAHSLWQSKENWFNFNKGSMLVLYRKSGVFILDLEKKAMEKVMDCALSRFVHKPNLATCVAYEMDLVEFFILQLGGVRDGLRTISEIES